MTPRLSRVAVSRGHTPWGTIVRAAGPRSKVSCREAHKEGASAHLGWMGHECRGRFRVVLKDVRNVFIQLLLGEPANLSIDDEQAIVGALLSNRLKQRES